MAVMACWVSTATRLVLPPLPPLLLGSIQKRMCNPSRPGIIESQANSDYGIMSSDNHCLKTGALFPFSGCTSPSGCLGAVAAGKSDSG